MSNRFKKPTPTSDKWTDYNDADTKTKEAIIKRNKDQEEEKRLRPKWHRDSLTADQIKLLDKACDDYPYKTLYINYPIGFNSGKICQVFGVFRYDTEADLITDSCGGAVYLNGEWAKKVSEQELIEMYLESLKHTDHLKGFIPWNKIYDLLKEEK